MLVFESDSEEVFLHLHTTHLTCWQQDFFAFTIGTAAGTLVPRACEPANRAEGGAPSRAKPREAAGASSFAELNQKLLDYRSRDCRSDPYPTWRAVKL